MADNETIADIIAEMRGIRVREFQDYADRLEAAHRREVATTKESLAVGNSGDCAKLREAVKLCMDEMCSRCRELAAARSNPLPCLQGCEPVRKAKAALAAPPRNCDRFQTKFDAKRAWEKVCKAGLPEQGPFEDWIFAPATEQEGGSDAD